jgi:multimeric flavodoxin WrbA
MNVKAKVAVIYYGAADLRGFRLALSVAAGAWDAGAEVRVRRVEQLAPPAGARSDPTWAELLREAEDVPAAGAQDLEWADAVLFGTSVLDGAVRAQLGKLIHAILPVLGGVFVPFGATAPAGADPDGSSPAEMAAGTPSAAELAAAHDQGRRVAETALALKSGRPPLAEVA